MTIAISNKGRSGEIPFSRKAAMAQGMVLSYINSRFFASAAARASLGLLLAAALFLSLPAARAETGYAYDLLVETDALPALLKQPNVVLVDGVDDANYQRIHIPGAVHLFYNQFADFETRSKDGSPAKVEDAEKLLGDAGIDNDTMVIIYDSGDGATASGLWFALEYFGHEKVRVLNGGFRKWMKEGRPVTQEVPKVEKKKFIAKARELGVSIKAKSHPRLRRTPRYLYACPSCEREYPRQRRLRMASCGYCTPGKTYNERYKLRLVTAQKR